jgi:hypothetical protein
MEALDVSCVHWVFTSATPSEATMARTKPSTASTLPPWMIFGQRSEWNPQWTGVPVPDAGARRTYSSLRFAAARCHRRLRRPCCLRRPRRGCYGACPC